MPAKQTNRPRAVVPWFKIVGAFAALLGIAATLHAAVLLPAVKYSVTEDTRELIREHSRHPHSGTVTHKELTLILGQLEKLATRDQVVALSERLARVEALLDER